jgi:hypothetical protein
MIVELLERLIPVWIAGAVILNIVVISFGGAMLVVWLLGGLWRLLFGNESRTCRSRVQPRSNVSWAWPTLGSGNASAGPTGFEGLLEMATGQRRRLNRRGRKHGGVMNRLSSFVLAAAIVAPNPTITPGATRPLTRAQICSTAWGRDVRHVTTSMKREIAKRYGLAFPVPYKVEWDHLIPRELGGADDVRNLWPQPWTDARTIKDPEENRLHKLVCQGLLSLSAAQDQMRHWRKP